MFSLSFSFFFNSDTKALVDSSRRARGCRRRQHCTRSCLGASAVGDFVVVFAHSSFSRLAQASDDELTKLLAGSLIESIVVGI